MVKSLTEWKYFNAFSGEDLEIYLYDDLLRRHWTQLRVIWDLIIYAWPGDNK